MLKKCSLVAMISIGLLIANFIPLSSESTFTRDFFIDYTGENNCMIIVGENAAASDAMSAAWIAAQIGTMTYYEESKAEYFYNDLTYYSNDGTYNKMNTNTGTGAYEDNLYIDHASSDDNSKAVLPFTDNYRHKWEYDVYIDPFTQFDEESSNWLVDTGFSYETISLDMSIKDDNKYQELLTFGSPATKQSSASSQNLELNEYQTYPSIYPRHYWGSKGNEYYDPLGGLEYRVIAYGMEEPFNTKQVTGMTIDTELMTVDSSEDINELIMESGNLFFLGDEYSCLSFGTDAEGYDYMMYGTPEWELLEMNEKDSYDFENGWSFNIVEIDIYEASMTIRLTGPQAASRNYKVSLGESITIKDNILQGLEASIVSIELGKITLKDIASASVFVYSIDDYGSLRETIFNVDEPYYSDMDTQWHLDVVPGDDIQENDIDNNIELFQNGNPSYDVSDRLMTNHEGVEGNEFMPYLELWLATPIENDGGRIMVSLSADGENEYFHIDISDQFNGDLIIDDYIIVGRTTKQVHTERNYVEIDSTAFVIRDVQVDVNVKSEYNLILVGGPVVNELVHELIELGVTNMDVWTRSSGECILYEDAFVNGKDVVVVAGKDRDATNKASKYLLDVLNSL